ncbi:hypothetical protein [Ferrimonas aestuarii]|uniref:Uncharacterized protein n=1 Tax=Ferrimonas aestuarii TaxID=2569539 RepID=A0A4U1BLK2_9GAMM|nr:hypothetical protein [Ferrimonas aestuarii]TKB53021.1 hypothetical protein FCL42_15170 [Ferrimonas aestuarii]
MKNKLSRLLDSLPLSSQSRDTHHQSLWVQLAAVLGIAAILLGWGLGHTLEQHRQQISAQRFSQIQLFSHRLSDSLLALQQRGEIISQIGVLKYLLAQPKTNARDVEVYLQGLVDKLDAIEMIELYDNSGALVLHTRPYQDRSYRGEADARQPLGESRAQFSPMLLNQERHQIGHWQKLPVADNDKGIQYATIFADLSTQFTAFHRSDPLGEIPLILFSDNGDALSLSQHPLQQTEKTRLWQRIEQHDFGQQVLQDKHYLFVKIQAGNFDPFYLVSFVDERQLLDFSREAQQKLVIVTLIFTLLFFWLVIQRHGVRKQQQHYHHALTVVENVFEQANALILLSRQGKLLLANPNAQQLLAELQPDEQPLWFYQLFSEEDGDYAWSQAIEFGNWQGRLTTRQNTGVEVKLQSNQQQGFGLILMTLNPSSSLELHLPDTSLGLALLNDDLLPIKQNKQLSTWLVGSSECLSSFLGTHQNEIRCALEQHGHWQSEAPVKLNRHHCYLTLDHHLDSGHWLLVAIPNNHQHESVATSGI